MNKATENLKLIGSQESSLLGVPNFTEIREHLCLKLQSAKENIEPPIETWNLIHLLAKTPAAVSNLMRYYYEPTDEDRLLKRKLPNHFHLELAQSITLRTGQIIITTNRDRLIEWGLARIGIAAQIIKDQQDLANSIPFQQTRCTLIKLNGDYLDTDCPQFDRQFKLFLQKEIQQFEQPIFLKCCPADRAKLAEFSFYA